MNANAAATELVVVDRYRDANDVPNLVKALTCAGSCAGLYLGSHVKVENTDKIELPVAALLAGVGGATGFLFGYTIHYSLLAIVDGVRMVSNCFRNTSSNPVQSPSEFSKPVAES